MISTNGTITRFIVDAAGDVLLCTGVTLPTDAEDGFAKGCLFIDTDVATGTVSVYVNQGTKDSCSFKLVNVDTVVTAEIAADAIDGTKIADDAVSLEHLDAGITPSHKVVLAGKLTMGGGNAAEAETVTGMLATDFVVATITDNSTNENVSLLEAKPGTDTLTFLFNEDPGANVVVDYVAFRVVA